jgi:hypothetical protein
MQLADFYFVHEEMFVLPIEHLSPQGMSGEYAGWLNERRALPSGWVERFNAAFACAWERASLLEQRAPRHWPPPRLQHCCIITAATRVRPYFQPFNNSAWLLYVSDFDPTHSSLEMSAYLFLHMERMGLLRDVTQTLLSNLAYWLILSDAEIADFVAGCAVSNRPDAAGFRALAAALPWIRRLHDDALKPPLIATLEPTDGVPHTGLQLPRSSRPRLDGLLRQWSAAAQASLDAFYAAHARRGRDRAGELCSWLRDERPRVVVSGNAGQVLWDPELPGEIASLRRSVGGLGETVAASLRADIELIDRHSRRFCQSLAELQSLPEPHAETTQGGLSYMHLTRKCIAYNLHEPGMERLRVPAPPYERLMLGARTIHEWGHLAADAGWIRVPAQNKDEHDSLVAALAEQFERLVRDAPPAVRRLTAEETERVARRHGSIGGGLAAIPLSRMPDYQANLLARHYLSDAELETYVRNNVYWLSAAGRPAALFQRLARYSYEFQYLRLSRITDPRRYFLSSTWFVSEYCATQVLREEDFAALLELVGRLCDLQQIDETKFRWT